MSNVTEIDYVLNTFFLMFAGSLVMFMSAGFAMLEAGMVRSKSVAAILLKNIGIYAIASIAFYLAGYNFMYENVAEHNGLFGTFSIWTPDHSVSEGGDLSAGHAPAAAWFFQMVFVATTASIVSGALAERIKIIPFFIFVAVLTSVLYPITGSWVWGSGWLSEMGFTDFAGSTLVHSVGGWAALSGALVLGARKGRFPIGGQPVQIESSSMPLVTLGTFILWFGWFGFNGGSQLAIASVDDANAVAKILTTTNLAASAGVIATIVITFLIYKRFELPMSLNGALAGLVAITADPLSATIAESLIIGTLGAVVMILCTIALEKLKIDDVVGAVPVHLAGGIVGTIAVAFTNPAASLHVQVIGVIAVGLFIFISSYIIWMICEKVGTGIRLHYDHEEIGSDIAELGMKAYNVH